MSRPVPSLRAGLSLSPPPPSCVRSKATSVWGCSLSQEEAALAQLHTGVWSPDRVDLGQVAVRGAGVGTRQVTNDAMT